MGFRILSSGGVLGGTRRASAILAALLFLTGITTTRVFAGDLSAQPVDSRSVVGSTTSAMLQYQPTQPEAAPVAAPAPPAGGPAESSWQSRFHVTGYLNQVFGMWLNPPATKQFTGSRNNLSTARTTLQIDENFQLNENNSFFARQWFTYDPPYSWNSNNNYLYSHANPKKPHGQAGLSVGPHSFGHFTNDALNQPGVPRDAWWQTKLGPLTVFTGQQIVVWGQSISFRVGDVINPNDASWAFGFANLEQSRKPQLMVHPLLYLPEWGPLGSNFLEAVVVPGFQPQWWSCSYADGRYNGYVTKCGRTATGQTSLSAAPLMRFELSTPQKLYYPFNRVAIGNNINGPFDKGPLGNGVGNNGLIGGLSIKEFMFCNPGPNDAGRNNSIILGAIPGVTNWANSTPVFMRRACNNHLSKNFSTIGALGDGSANDLGRFRIRGYQPQFWNEGLRFHTLFGPAELTTFVWYDNIRQGALGDAKWVPYTNLFEYDAPASVEFGATADAPLPLPESIAEHFPMVGRAEMLYINHRTVGDLRPYTLTTRQFSDQVNWMAAIDLTNAYAPWLTSTGDLTANVEVFDSIMMDINKFTRANDRNDSKILKNPIQILFNAGTSYYYGDIAPTFTTIFAPKGRTFLLFPAVQFNPPWTKKYFAKLQFIDILGGDRQAAQVGGTFKGEGMANLTLQYNFDVM